MSGSTPNYAFPYPSLTDSPDGASQIQALASAVDTTLAAQVAALQASISAITVPQFALKTADQSVTSNTTLQNDTALVLPVAANAKYRFESYLDYEASGAGALKWQWSVPSGGTLRYAKIGINTGLTAEVVTLTGSAIWTAGGGGAGSLQGIHMAGTLIMGSSAGNLQLLWAQNASSTTPTIVHAQSLLALWRIS